MVSCFRIVYSDQRPRSRNFIAHGVGVHSLNSVIAIRTLLSFHPFDVILDRVTGSYPSVTDYILESPAKCPNCRCEILEQTLIEPA